MLTLTPSNPLDVESVAEITSSPSSFFLSCCSTVGGCCGLLAFCFLDCAGCFGARESGSNVSVSSSLSEWVDRGSRSGVKGMKVDSEESMLLLSLSSPVCTSSKKICSSLSLGRHTMGSDGLEESELTQVLNRTTGSTGEQTNQRLVLQPNSNTWFSLVLHQGARQAALLPVCGTDGTAGPGTVIFFNSLAPPCGTLCDGLWLSTSSWVGRGGLRQPPRVSSSSCLWWNLRQLWRIKNDVCYHDQEVDTG